MNTILITGARGFIGRNLASHLRHRDDVRVLAYDLGGTEAELRRGAAEADVVFHLAGVNRPRDPAKFEAGNAGFTEHLKPRARNWSSISRAFGNLAHVGKSVERCRSPRGARRKPMGPKKIRLLGRGGRRGSTDFPT